MQAKTLTLRDLWDIEDVEDTRQKTVLILARGVVDDEGNRLFDDDDEEGVGKLEAPKFKRLLSEVMSLSGMEEDEPGNE